AGLRTAQMCNVAADANAAADPVVIAGDTNLPGSSWAFAHCLGGFQDGFATAGNGFGYTFPWTKRRRPWMRIDSILANARFRFLHFEVVPPMSSDHRAVIADLDLAPAR
ncbi:MAG TPA: endonuclease/exonuclease/phosphatase family protein, partial [Polyangia bacterium]|nr:endonuclease/exonuclease/phosphatase family protein [Polyangia bacterium]